MELGIGSKEKNGKNKCSFVKVLQLSIKLYFGLDQCLGSKGKWTCAKWK